MCVPQGGSFPIFPVNPDDEVIIRDCASRMLKSDLGEYPTNICKKESDHLKEIWSIKHNKAASFQVLSTIKSRLKKFPVPRSVIKRHFHAGRKKRDRLGALAFVRERQN